ncbi:hypothetical protein CWS33_29025, partial [Escherichia coli]
MGHGAYRERIRSRSCGSQENGTRRAGGCAPDDGRDGGIAGVRPGDGQRPDDGARRHRHAGPVAR